MKKLLLTLSLGLFATGSAFAEHHEKTGAKEVNAKESFVKWTGYGVGKSHWGHVSLSKAEVKFEKGEPVSGEVVVDLKTIATKDIGVDQGAKKLNGHLMAEDFFHVEEHPTAKFVAKSITKQKDHSYKVKGDFTVKGITKSQELVLKHDMKKNSLVGTLSFDRTDFGVQYNSKKFFSLENLKDKVIEDKIDLEIHLALK